MVRKIIGVIEFVAVASWVGWCAYVIMITDNSECKYLRHNDLGGRGPAPRDVTPYCITTYNYSILL